MGGRDKSKANKKAEKKTDVNKITPIDRTFYELTIADLNQKLARLRVHFQNLDEANSNLNERLVALEEDRIDVSAHLERKLSEREDTICELKERLVEVTKVRKIENTESQEKIRELEARYKAMSDQLTSEIKLLNGKLNSLEEFRVQKDALLSKFDDQESELKEKERVHKETLYNLEQLAVVERDALKREVERKLLKVAEDFMRSNEIRNAGYTHRLIRENIALQKELDSAITMFFEMKKKCDESMKHCRSAKTRETADEEIRQQLIFGHSEKINIIAQLMRRCELLKAECCELKSYREKYERLILCQTCERFREVDVAAQKRNLKQRIERLQKEREHLCMIVEQQSLEIRRMHNLIEKITATIVAAIDENGNLKKIERKDMTSDKLRDLAVPAVIEIEEGLLKQARENLSRALTEIINRGITGKLTDDQEAKEISLQKLVASYRPGQMGFMRTPRKSSKTLIELFKRETRIVSHTAHLCKPIIVLEEKQQESSIIPKGRPHNANALLDVEYGPMLFFSLSHDEDATDIDSYDNNMEGISMPALSDTVEANKGDVKGTDSENVEEESDFDINLFY